MYSLVASMNAAGLGCYLMLYTMECDASQGSRCALGVCVVLFGRSSKVRLSAFGFEYIRANESGILPAETQACLQSLSRHR